MSRWWTVAALVLVSVGTGAAQNKQATGSGPIVTSRPDGFPLGRSGTGEPCAASRSWRDPAARDLLDESWALTCRNVAASRPLGFVRLLGKRSWEALEKAECAPVLRATIAGVGEVDARRCIEPALGGAEAVRLSRRWRGRWLTLSAAPAALGVGEVAMRRMVNPDGTAADPDTPAPASVQLATLPAWGDVRGARPQASDAAFDASLPLAQGINLNHQGLYLEASRVLNDALSRLGPDVPADQRIELQLEAGLSDSNIGFSTSAGDHFAEADALIARTQTARETFLRAKRQAYGGLELLNRRRFREALAQLDQLVSQPADAREPLTDPAALRALNGAAAGRGPAAAVRMPDTASLAQLTLDAQVQWVRSAALLALGDEVRSRAALERADAAYASLLTERIDPTLVLWLGAQIQRQRGRLEARVRDYPAALKAYDAAINALRRTALGTAGTGREPAIAEAMLERTVILDQSGAREQARIDYGTAVDALAAANQLGGSVQPIGLDRYLDLLVAEAAAGGRVDTQERAFRAMQATGESAVARQVRQLQAVVAADPAVGTKLRDRADLEREITRLRYEIAGEDGSTRELEMERDAAEWKLLQIDAALSSNRRFSTLDDRTVTVADVRASLKPGEAYWKLTTTGGAVYGFLATAQGSRIWRIAVPAIQLDRLAAAVRGSVDGQLAQGKLVPFDVAGSYALFRLLTGDATDAVLAARALVIDPAGPLRALPAGLLVTSRASVDAYRASAKVRPFDFTPATFLASQTTISTSVSPRSFLVTRALPPSAAKRPLIAFGEHRPPVVDGPSRQVRVGFGCYVPFATLVDLARRLPPIDRRELSVAATSLGYPNAPQVTDAAFTDTAILARTDMADYQVLHFGTHGLKEGDWGCSKSPPALVTSFGDDRSDGLLSFAEVARLRLDANLVFLSACDTASGIQNEALARGSGQEEAGSTLEGLVRAFLTANARAVLATYWQVSAEGETDRFIQTLYGAARNQDVGSAVQAAQIQMMKEPATSHPFYWAPYFLVGDATKPMLSAPAAAAPRVAAR